MPTRSFLALALLLGVAARAPVNAADPLDAKASVAPLTHRSVFGSYRAHDDAKPVPWREANDTVGRIGGWRTYAREAATPQAPAASQPSPMPQAVVAPPAVAAPKATPPGAAAPMAAPAASAAPAHRHH